MSCIQQPVSLCKRIQSTLTRFWYNGPDKNRKICWISCKTLTKPKSGGGWGLQDIQLFNQTLLTKLTWRIIISPDCLLSRVLRGKYYHSKGFLEANVPDVCSHGWRRSIHPIHDLLKSNMGKTIKNGESTKVWKYFWMSLSENINPFGPCPEADIDLRVSDLLTNDFEWNKKMIEEILQNLSLQIQCLKPSMRGSGDIYVWQPIQSDIYSTKSCYFTVYEKSKYQLPAVWAGFQFDKRCVVRLLLPKDEGVLLVHHPKSFTFGW